jgi:hypothetical protein
MKMLRGRVDMGRYFLNFWQKAEVNGQRHALAAFIPGKEIPVPIGYEVVWAPESVSKRRQKRNVRPAGNRTPILRSTSP